MCSLKKKKFFVCFVFCCIFSEVRGLCALLSGVQFYCLVMFSQVLCGDVVVFSELKDFCETWYHLLISRLLYQNPTVRPTDLGFHVQVGGMICQNLSVN